MVIEGFTMGVGGLFMGENLGDGVWKKAGAGFRWVCVLDCNSDKTLLE